MNRSATRDSRRWLVPQTVQTSQMDCGPAAMHALLAGMGIRASYGRLREACQTDVDGTAIEALEECSRALGLEVAQLMLPSDHVALPAAGALPALAVSRLPNGMPHFVVAWRRHGPFVQLMDPGTGRRLVRARGLRAMLHVHEQPVPAAAWAAFSQTPGFCAPLTERLRALGVGRDAAHTLMSAAGRAGPAAMAALDAQARAAADGDRAASGSLAALTAAVEDPVAARERLPREAWFARSLDPTPEDPDPGVLLRGAVLVRAYGPTAEPVDPDTLTTELRAAITEPAPRPAQRLLAAARAEGRVPLRALLGTAATLAAGTIAEIALLQTALEGPRPASVLVAVAGLAAVLMIVETAAAALGLAVGRRLEVGLRRALLSKLPRLPDRYLRSRAPSDMAERAHVVHALRLLPLLLVQLVSAASETLLVAGALCVLDPAGAPLVVAATVLVLAVALVVQWPLREREQREREHSGALSQTTLDALLGVLALRAHGGERALESEQRTLLAGWRTAAGASARARAAATLVQAAFGIGLTIWVVLDGLSGLDDAGGRLLFVLWAIMLPFAAERVSALAVQWPGMRAVALRLAEPLDAPDAPGSDAPAAAASVLPAGGGAEIVLEEACVRATGHVVLAVTSLRLVAGEHVALVGASGAGKSTLCSLVLGLLEPSGGRVLVDGVPLDRAAARGLWPSVAWVDSQVRVWNRSLAENLAPGASEDRVAELVEAAELERVAERVGAQPLGADGGLLSGGEAQRVRLARAFGRSEVRLVVLDEALRGLDRGQRLRLLARARERWRDATLVCATHDVEDGLAFDRILVLDGGRVVEQGRPDELLHTDGSRLRTLVDAERMLRAELDDGRGWRRLRVGSSTLREAAAEFGPPAPQPPAPPARRSSAPAAEAAPVAGPSPVARVAWALALFVAATAARFGAFAGSWAVIGSAIVDADVSGSRLAPWALLLAATVPCAALATWAEGRIAVGLGTILRHRLLHGAFALDPAWIRREGPGRVLGRTLEVDAVSRLAITGGLGALTAGVEIAVAFVALLAVAPGRPAAALLALVLLAGSATALHAARQRVAWTTARLGETDELLEAIAGQRTRLVQGGDTGDAGRERRLARYLALSRSADRPLALLAGALPRAALVAGLLGLALAARDASTGELATALGGVLLAAQAMGGVAAATDALITALLAARSLKPILAAARGAGPAADPAADPPARPAAAPLGPVAPAGPPGSPTDGPPTTPGLTAQGLAVDRDGHRVLHAVDVTLAPGERVILTGASGAGKSTLAAALAGLLPASAGTLAYDGRALTPAAASWRSHVQLLPQHNDNHVLLAPLAFNLLLGRGWPPTEEDLRDATEICHELELGPLLERMPAGISQHVGETGWQLSQGERARVQLARALLADPDVLLLDEPLGALDPATARIALDVVRRRARTLVLISQE